MSLDCNSSGETKEMTLMDNFSQYHNNNCSNVHVHFSDIVVNIDVQRKISLTSPKLSPGILRQGVLKNHNGNQMMIDLLSFDNSKNSNSFQKESKLTPNSDHLKHSTPQSPPLSENVRDKVFPFPNGSVDNVNGINNGKEKHHQGIRSVELRSNLVRTQIDRDPMKYYKVLNNLGMGSLGNVTSVRKHRDYIGGSARQKIVDIIVKDDTKSDSKLCFQVPLIGKLLRFCVFRNDNIRENDQDAFVIVPNISKKLKDENDNDTSINIKVDHQHDIIYAMKSIRLLHASDVRYLDELKNEVDILKELDHPHIVRVIETFHYQKQMFVIMELCSGGDLYSRDPYTEIEAAHVCASIVSAIAYTHSRGILHRDLKYENILFATPDPKSEIRLIDFGLSKAFGEVPLTDGVGTTYTMAPEVLKGNYTKQADLWSIGVVAAMLLSSQMPFYGRTREDVEKKIILGKYRLKGRQWRQVSRQGRCFVSDLLLLDPSKRSTAEEALRSPWLDKYYDMTTRDVNECVENEMHTKFDDNKKREIRESLARFTEYPKLKKVALMVVAHKSTSDEIGILRKVFQRYDTSRTGQYQYDQFKEAMSETGFSGDDLSKIFDSLDIDGSGKIRYTEFLAATIEAHGAISEQRLAEAFDRIDSDDSGFISADNVREMLGASCPQTEIDDILHEASTRGDEKVTYSDFLAMWGDRNETNHSQSTRELQYSSSSSNETDDSSNDDFIISRSNFINAKFISENQTNKMNSILV